MDYAETSRAAFAFIKAHGIDARNEAEAVKALHTRGDATCEELEDFTGIKHQSMSATLTGLRKAGLIERTGEKRPTRSGVSAFVLRVVPEEV